MNKKLLIVLAFVSVLGASLVFLISHAEHQIIISSFHESTHGLDFAAIESDVAIFDNMIKIDWKSIFCREMEGRVI
jgi:hypothetical protein